MAGKKKAGKAAVQLCRTCGQPLPKKRNPVAAGVLTVRNGTVSAALGVRSAGRRVQKYQKRLAHLMKAVDAFGRML